MDLQLEDLRRRPGEVTEGSVVQVDLKGDQLAVQIHAPEEVGAVA